MPRMTQEQIAEFMADRVKRYVAEHLAPLQASMVELRAITDQQVFLASGAAARLSDLEDRPAPTNGKDADPAVIEQMVADRVAPLEKELADLRSLASEFPVLITGFRDDVNALKALPVPTNGKDADPAVIQAMVDEAVKAIPAPKDGDPGKDADPLEIVKAVLALIPTPAPGRDGIGTREELVAVARELITLELDAAVEKAVTFAVAQVPRIEYKGVWEPGEHTRGNCTTWGGSLWICVVEKTTAKPETNADWKLAVKRGRDGR